MASLQPKDFMIYYATVLVVIFLLLFRRRRRKGMRLRLGGSGRKAGLAAQYAVDKLSRVSETGERPLNVVFNFNGHSWDAYEVLGLPAGSSLENVEAAFAEAMADIDEASKPFLQAARDAIHSQWRGFRQSGS